MPHCKLLSELRNSIRDEILANGPIPFARFMQLALYSPEFGYYEQPRTIGRAGDFYTSVSVGPVFGQLLAHQFATWLTNIEKKAEPSTIVEVGAHDGRLAADILNCLEVSQPEVFRSLNYCIIEPSAVRSQLQRSTLSRFGTTVHWFNQLSEVPPVTGIIFSNELLDAFPVHRIFWSAQANRWQEYYVSWTNEDFCWSAGPLSFPANEINVPTELLPFLPDGFIFELSRAAVDWWQQAAAKLHKGKLLAIDYGYTQDEYFRSGKINGTLRAYRQHRVSDNLLAYPGEQDLTAHVDFNLIERAGERAALKTEALTSQSRFLTEIFQQMSSKADFNWSANLLKQFQTLVSPDHLGRFKVLVQEP